MAAKHDREEQYILRVQDRALAGRIRTLLQTGTPQQLNDTNLHLNFDGEGQGRTGMLAFEGEEFPFSLLDLPTILESYKTYNDVDLVKSTDIGQVIVVKEQSASTQEAVTEYKHGITPPMRDVRKRMFRPADLPSPAALKQMAQNLLLVTANTSKRQIYIDKEAVKQLLVERLYFTQGSAPEGMEFVDVEEEYQVDEDGHGAWKALPPIGSKEGKPPPAPARKSNPKAKKERKPKKAAQEK